MELPAVVSSLLLLAFAFSLQGCSFGAPPPAACYRLEFDNGVLPMTDKGKSVEPECDDGYEYDGPEDITCNMINQECLVSDPEKCHNVHAFGPAGTGLESFPDDAEPMLVTKFTHSWEDYIRARAGKGAGDTRKFFAEKVDFAAASADKAMERAREAADHAKTYAEQAKDRAAEAVEIAKSHGEAAAAHAREAAQRAADRASEAANHAHALANHAAEQAKEVHEAAKTAAGDVSNRMQAKAEEAAAHAQKLAEEAKDRAHSAVADVKDAAHDLKAAAEEHAAHAAEHASNAVNHVKESASSAADAARERTSSALDAASSSASSALDAASEHASNAVSAASEHASNAHAAASEHASNAAAAAQSGVDSVKAHIHEATKRRLTDGLTPSYSAEDMQGTCKAKADASRLYLMLPRIMRRSGGIAPQLLVAMLVSGIFGMALIVRKLTVARQSSLMADENSDEEVGSGVE